MLILRTSENATWHYELNSDNSGDYLQESFISELLRWIDDNIERDIAISQIVERSGYSSAHLHRLFKANVGCSLNEYVMRKRLYKCALVLKFTATPISELSSRYHYANTQTFSRFFKLFFGVSPAEFRQNTTLGIHQRFTWKHHKKLKISNCKIEFVHIGKLKLYGISEHYERSIENLGKPHINERSVAEIHFQHCIQRPTSELYTLCRPVRRNSQGIIFEYNIGILFNEIPLGVELTPLPFIAGDYLAFTFQATDYAPYEMASMAYWEFMSKYNIKRRDGYDIEKYDYVKSIITIYIPVLFDDSLLDALLVLQEAQNISL